MKSKYKAMVLSCMDPRFQHLVHSFLKKKKLTGKYSAFTIAGAAVGVTHNKFKKWHNTFYDNLTTSIQLHKIEKLLLLIIKIVVLQKLLMEKKNLILKMKKKYTKTHLVKLKKKLKKDFQN
jgi:carbonic anhydrase